MNEMPRFMKEYANYILKDIGENDLMKQTYKNDIRKKVKRVLEEYEKGYVTTYEAMDMLTRCI